MSVLRHIGRADHTDVPTDAGVQLAGDFDAFAGDCDAFGGHFDAFEGADSRRTPGTPLYFRTVIAGILWHVSQAPPGL